MPSSFRLFALTAFLALSGAASFAANATAEALLVPITLPGTSSSVVKWTDLSEVNGTRTPVVGTGTIAPVAPGYQGTLGFYSWGGDYAATVGTSAAFDINNVVLQLIGMTVSGAVIGGGSADYTPEDHLTFAGGPVLTYTYAGGTGTLAAPHHGTLSGPLFGVGSGGSGNYYSFTWQWDLSAIPQTVTSISIHAPLRLHSSTVGAQINIGGIFSQVVGAPALTALEQWRQTLFNRPYNSGDGADANDYDADGVPNLLEYALGRLPKIPDSAGATTVALNAAGTRLVLGFTRVADPALNYIVEAKNDLGEAVWTDITPATLGANVAGPASVEDTQNLSASPRRFLRLRVEAN